MRCIMDSNFALRMDRIRDSGVHLILTGLSPVLVPRMDSLTVLTVCLAGRGRKPLKRFMNSRDR